VTALIVEGLSIATGDAAIVSGIGFTVAPGRPVTLLGQSGSGKSLVMHAIMGSLPAGLTASGSVRLGDQDLLSLDPGERRALWGRTMSLLPQEPWLALDPTVRVGTQLAEAHRRVRGMTAADARARAGADLAEVGLDAAGTLYPFQMSGGMAQRAAIAMVHGAGSALILADEPTKGLDAGLRDGVAARLRREAADRLLLTITHDTSVARGIGGTVAVMTEGRIVEVGPADEVLSAPRHPYTQALVAAEPARWPAPAPRAATGAPVLEAEDLACAIGRRTLFEELDLAIRPGEVVAVSAPSGFGKTMLGNALLGLVRPSRGQVTRAPGTRPTQFQKIYQDPPASFAPHQRLDRGIADLLARHAIDPARLPPLLDRLEVDPRLLARRPAEVSGGELQRVAIARALLVDPVFLFADEATSRLDLLAQQQVIGLLLDLVRERGLALMLVTHDAVLAERVADRHIDLAAFAPR
jgi:peptide/nickel transport system ATP-binding protein